MEQAAAADAGAGSATFRACVEFTRLRNILFFCFGKGTETPCCNGKKQERREKMVQVSLIWAMTHELVRCCLPLLLWCGLFIIVQFVPG